MRPLQKWCHIKNDEAASSSLNRLVRARLLPLPSVPEDQKTEIHESTHTHLSSKRTTTKHTTSPTHLLSSSIVFVNLRHKLPTAIPQQFFKRRGGKRQKFKNNSFSFKSAPQYHNVFQRCAKTVAMSRGFDEQNQNCACELSNSFGTYSASPIFNL